MVENVCRTCGVKFKPSHNTTYYCSDDHTPYKNKLMGWDVWRSMYKRCYDPKTNGYDKYGAKGITVDERWRNYKDFVSDMGLRPTAKHQLDRIDPTLGYSKENCRWVTTKENARSRRTTKLIIYKGVAKPITTWAEELGFADSTFAARIKLWGLERAFETPRGPSGPKRKLSAMGVTTNG